MRRSAVLLLPFAVLLVVWPFAGRADFQVKPDKENVVASRLEGTWQVEAALSKRLNGRADPAIERFVTFKSDPKVAATIPAMYEKFLKDRQIFMAGTMTFNKKTYPFLLISHRGNPHVVYFRERGGDPLGDAESFNLMLAVAADPANDLLFIGGDFNNQPFGAFERVREAKKE